MTFAHVNSAVKQLPEWIQQPVMPFMLYVEIK